MQNGDDLFGNHNVLEILPMQDADVSFAPKIEIPRDLAKVLRELIAEIPWRAEKVTVWGKKFDQPRLIAWYGDDGRKYTYSGIEMDPSAWSPLLLMLKSAVERVAGVSFNSALLNYYRNEQDSMGFHSDDEPELGPHPVIASLSLGEERTFVFKHKTSEILRPVKLRLTSGSLLLMKGSTQKNWKHGIQKEKTPCGPRVNITFRQIRVR
jgi:alkylated DNA repair dioxygenase AlkB